MKWMLPFVFYIILVSSVTGFSAFSSPVSDTHPSASELPGYGAVLEGNESSQPSPPIVFTAAEWNGTLPSLYMAIDSALSSGRKALIFFYADWCFFCQMEKPIIADLERRYADEAVFIQINEAENAEALRAFGVNRFPTIFIIKDGHPANYTYQVFKGFTNRTALEKGILGSSGAISLEGPMKNDPNYNPGGFFTHHSCSFWECVDACTDKKDVNWDSIVQEVAETVAGCFSPLGAPYTCTKMLLTKDPNDIVSCLSNALELLGTGASCSYSVGHLLADILGAEQLGSCLGECAADAGSYGGLCQQGEQQTACAGSGGLGFIGLKECSDCEWHHVPGSVRSCGAGQVCVEDAGGARCKDDDDDDDDDPNIPPNQPPYRPGGDTPDDNYDVSTGWLANSFTWLSGTVGTSNIAVLDRGYPRIFGGLVSFISSLGEYPTLIDTRYLTIINPREYPVLIIPSGGLFGLTGSRTIRSELERYVSSGGTLIVFTQQRGSDFSILPGGGVKGFGWREDQSCWYRSISVNEFHPIFSSLEEPRVISVRVDGFFTRIPENATTLLTRNKNGMPAMIIYQYGRGQVIATTTFADLHPWKQEKELLRGLFLWAESRKPVPIVREFINTTYSFNFTNQLIYSPSWREFKKGDLVSIPFNITNYGNETANLVRFTLIDPRYNIEYVNVPAQIERNTTIIVDFRYKTADDSSAGIWIVLYYLYNGSSRVWSGYAGAFTLDFNISQITSFKADFNITNPHGELQSNQSILFTAMPSETREFEISFNPDTMGMWTISYRIQTLSNVTVDSGIQRVAVSPYSSCLEGWTYQGENVTYSITSDYERYVRGEMANFTIHIWNKGDTERNITVTWSFPHHFWSFQEDIYGPPGTTNPRIGSLLNRTVHIGADSYVNFTYSIPVKARLDRLWANFWEAGHGGYRLLGGASRAFYGVFPPIHSRVYVGDIVNGSIPIRTHTKYDFHSPTRSIFTLQVLNASETLLFNDTFPVRLQAGKSYRYNFSIPITSSFKPGYYWAKLKIYSSYGHYLISYTWSIFKIPKVEVTINTDKLEYRQNENMTIIYTIMNNWISDWNQTISLSIPRINFHNETNVQLKRGEGKQIKYRLKIPSNATAGVYTILAYLLEEGTTILGEFTIRQSRLYYDFDVEEAQAGASLQVKISNVGGVGTNYSYAINLKDASWLSIVNETGAGYLDGGSSKVVSFTIPEYAVNGTYSLHITLTDLSTGEIRRGTRALKIDGKAANIDSTTDKAVYWIWEDTGISTLIESRNGDIQNGVLHLEIYRLNNSKIGKVGEFWEGKEGEWGFAPSSSLIWEKYILVDVNDTLLVNTTVSSPEFYDFTGKFRLDSTLISPTGQLLSHDDDTFYRAASSEYIKLKTDKEVYKPNEAIHVHAEVGNRGDSSMDLALTLYKNSTTLLNESFTLPPHATRSYNLTTSSDRWFYLTGEAGGFKINETIKVAEPLLNSTLIAPDLVGREPFPVSLELRNIGEVPLELNVDLDGSQHQLDILVGETAVLPYEKTIEENTTLKVFITGDVNRTYAKDVAFGENASLRLESEDLYLEGPVEVSYNVTNTGKLETRFNATFTVGNETTAIPVYLPVKGNITGTVTFNLTRGLYTLFYSTPFQEGNLTINVEAPAKIEVVSLPENQTYQLGQLARMHITIMNSGGVLGGANVSLTVPGLKDAFNKTWLEPGQEKEISFRVPIPDDLQEGYYPSTFDVNGEKYDVEFFVEGVNVSVDAELDKPYYSAGENATLTLTVENRKSSDLSLFAWAALGGYEDTVYFNLTAKETKVLTFEVPAVFDEGKLQYSVYMASGRALYINALYIYEKPNPSSGISLYTDKEVYTIGEHVTIHVNVTKPGWLNLTAPSFSLSEAISPGVQIYGFDVPKLRTGTYPINYSFDNYTDSYPIDVVGYSAFPINVTLDKRKYVAGETLEITIIVETNRDFDGLVKAWVFDPDNQLVGVGEANYTFSKGENIVAVRVPLSTTESGLFSFAFRIYAYGSFIWLSSGGGYFDVEDTTPPTVTIISPESRTYAETTIPLIYHIDEPATWTGYSLDGAANVTLTGNTTLTGLPEAQHTLTIYAVDTANNTGSSSVTFRVSQPSHPKPPGNKPPSAVTLSEPFDVTESSVKLAWTENNDTDFKEYIVYASTSPAELGEELAQLPLRNTTTYAAQGLPGNTTYYFIIRVVDVLGAYNDSNQVSAKTLPPDTEPPRLTILSPREGIYNQSSIELRWTVDEPLAWVGYSLNGGENTTLSGNQTIFELADGVYELALYATDLRGNTAKKSVLFEISTVVPDTEPPKIIHFPITEGVEGGRIEVHAVITDNRGVEEAAVYYRAGENGGYVRIEMASCPGCIDAYNATIPGHDVKTETIEYYIFASDGINNATDPEGAPAAGVHSIRIDLRPEPVTIYEPEEKEVSARSVRLSWSKSAADDFANYTVYRSSEEGVLGIPVTTISDVATTTQEISGLSPENEYYFTVRVYDHAGLYADSEQLGVVTRRESRQLNVLIVVGGLLTAALALIIISKIRGAKP